MEASRCVSSDDRAAACRVYLCSLVPIKVQAVCLGIPVGLTQHMFGASRKRPAAPPSLRHGARARLDMKAKQDQRTISLLYLEPLISRQVTFALLGTEDDSV